MKLLVEIIEQTEIVLEESAGTKNLYVVGPALVAEQKNKNGRVYPKETLAIEAKRYIKEHIDTGRAVGELGHPSGPNLNPDRISHKFVSLKEDGLSWIAKAKVLDTPTGKIAASLINEGVTLGFSSRGVGSLKPRNGIQEVQQDFRLSTVADIVMDPSAPGAFVTGIMENTEWYYDISKGTWVEKYIEPIVENVSKMSRKEREEVQVYLFESFLRGLSEDCPPKNPKKWKLVSKDTGREVVPNSHITDSDGKRHKVVKGVAPQREGHTGKVMTTTGMHYPDKFNLKFVSL